MRRSVYPIGPVTALLTGDSWTNYGAGDEYPNYLPTGDGLTWNNQGISATPLAAVTGASSLESRIAGELSAAPATDITVICSSGINDIAAGTTAAQLLTAVGNIQTAIEAANSTAVWVSVPIVAAWTAGAKTEATTHDTNLRDFCAARGLPFVRLMDIFSDSSGLLAKYAADGSHLNADGCALLSQFIMSAIKVTKYRKAAVA